MVDETDRPSMLASQILETDDREFDGILRTTSSLTLHMTGTTDRAQGQGEGERQKNEMVRQQPSLSLSYPFRIRTPYSKDQVKISPIDYLLALPPPRPPQGVLSVSVSLLSGPDELNHTSTPYSCYGIGQNQPCSCFWSRSDSPWKLSFDVASENAMMGRTPRVTLPCYSICAGTGQRNACRMPVVNGQQQLFGPKHSVWNGLLGARPLEPAESRILPRLWHFLSPDSGGRPPCPPPWSPRLVRLYDLLVFFQKTSSKTSYNQYRLNSGREMSCYRGLSNPHIAASSSPFQALKG
ncbi:uncharacterized protein BDZ83DRAFT_654148 [Colletotrichum acutatum]|uniref:Uncharacterized protein n=1 Tax=Glomerella acutata TaxID=27357 RepID=A0AAD8UKQ6_GLOAC|nr:uncharacterized protein BDZ83DRAFT_654148 [Colletotrichum acutatum]KAK1721489.1 hypothetical protein BDZ83DRAFT_654148 [Colletotrichum acutatum]